MDWASLSRIELTGDNTMTIATKAAFRAASESVPIGMDHVRGAMEAEFRKLDRESLGSPAS